MMDQDKIDIIIADDSKVFLEGIRFILSKENRYNIIDVCANGKELIESEKLPGADVILSDIEMPEIGGIQACKLINYRLPQIPIIALTMHLERVYLEDIVSAGFRGFIYKPEVPKKLFEVIEEVLKNRFVFPQNLNLK